LEEKLLNLLTVPALVIAVPALVAVTLGALAGRTADKSILAFNYFVSATLSSYAIYGVLLLGSTLYKHMHRYAAARRAQPRAPPRAKAVARVLALLTLSGVLAATAYSVYVWISLWDFICRYWRGGPGSA